MKYETYECDDFASDSFFRGWVKHPDEISQRYWSDFLQKNPEKVETVWQAVAVIRQLIEATINISSPTDDAEKSAIWKAVKQHIEAKPRM